jgi:uncharacterized protein YecE (DUF72 family)
VLFRSARLQQSRPDVPTGYDDAELDRWAATTRDWIAGKAPADLPYVAGPGGGAAQRDAFIFFIAGAKERNPAAARALIARLS